MGTAPLAARVSDPKGMENERRICVHYLWSGVTILNLLFPISPFYAFGYYRLARLGPTLDLFENYQGLCPKKFPFFWKGRNAGKKSFLSTGS